MAVKESERHIAATVDALRILDLFEEHGSLRLKDLVELTALNKSRVIRICGTLIYMGFLMYDARQLTYSLGTRIRTLGKAYARHNPLYSFGKPILEQLATETKETCSIFVVQDSAPMCLVRVEGPLALRFVISEGARNTKWLGASSKMLLAFADVTLQGEIVHKLQGCTVDGKKMALNDLEEELLLIRQRGFSFSQGELIPDVFGYSCPIYDYNDRVCAAISVTGPPHRVNVENEGFILALLKPAARQISEFLGAFNLEKVPLRR